MIIVNAAAGVRGEVIDILACLTIRNPHSIDRDRGSRHDVKDATRVVAADRRPIRAGSFNHQVFADDEFAARQVDR